jgi:hypothetical protein
LAYIGHSQGTTQMFFSLSKNPEYWKQRINVFFAFAPVTRLDNNNNKLLKWVSQYHTLFKDTMNLAKIYNLAPDNGFNRIFCSILPDVCKINEGLIVTSDPSLDDTQRYQVYMGHYPSGVSIQCLLHYAQIINEKKFKEFDWGSANLNQ